KNGQQLKHLQKAQTGKENIAARQSQQLEAEKSGGNSTPPPNSGSTSYQAGKYAQPPPLLQETFPPRVIPLVPPFSKPSKESKSRASRNKRKTPSNKYESIFH
ncbi:hypothetical protein S245_056465, partial [Arachis hypogaea]